MFKWFLSHQWKEMTRSNFWQKSLIINIIIGFLLMILLSYLVLLGLIIDKILLEVWPESDPFVLFNSGLLYYLGIDLIFRFFAYSLPVINIGSYIHLPIKKPNIVRYVLLKSSINIFNLLPLLVFIPFTLKVVLPSQSSEVAITWMVLMVIMVFNNSFILHYIKRRFFDKPIIAGGFAVFLIAAMVLDKFGVISISGYSSLLFIFLANNPVYLVFPVALLVFIYRVNFSYLRSKLTLEDINIKKQKKIDALSRVTYLNSFGELGEMIMLELKLIWRNKRSKSIIMMAPLFLLYGLFFYPNEIYREGWGFLIFVGLFMTGGIMFNYGQFLFAWESNYFDAILSNNIDLKKHIRVKYIVMVGSVVLCYILTIPYVFFGTKILFINTATFLFNLGLLTMMQIYFASNSKTRIDMTKGAAFNYQGMGATNWLMILPFFLLPIFIWLPFNLLGKPYYGIAAIAIVGILALAFHKQLMKVVFDRFMKRKYIMAKGFRES